MASSDHVTNGESHSNFVVLDSGVATIEARQGPAPPVWKSGGGGSPPNNSRSFHLFNGNPKFLKWKMGHFQKIVDQIRGVLFGGGGG